MQKSTKPKKTDIRKTPQAALREHRHEEANAEHSPAIKAHNRFIEKHGLFSDDWRKF